MSTYRQHIRVAKTKNGTRRSYRSFFPSQIRRFVNLSFISLWIFIGVMPFATAEEIPMQCLASVIFFKRTAVVFFSIWVVCFVSYAISCELNICLVLSLPFWTVNFLSACILTFVTQSCKTERSLDHHLYSLYLAYLGCFKCDICLSSFSLDRFAFNRDYLFFWTRVRIPRQPIWLPRHYPTGGILLRFKPRHLLLGEKHSHAVFDL